METIILSQEQKSVIQFSQPGAYAIKGIAGSGKTTVGLHRIHFLQEKCAQGEKILVVTYHKVLTDYLRFLEKELLKTVVERELPFQEKRDGVPLLNDKNKDVDIINIDKMIYHFYSKYRERKRTHHYYKNLPARASSFADINEIFQKALKQAQNKYPQCKILQGNSYFLKDEIDYINNCRIDNIKHYQIFTRKGRNRNEEMKKTLLKKSQTREAIFYLRRKYNNMLIFSGGMDFPIMRLLALREVSENPPHKYTHLIIDECQDLDRTRLDFLKFFIKPSKTSSATFLYDNTQSIYNGSWLGSGHGFSSLGIDILGNRSRILKRNYRTTYEIQSAAQALIKHNGSYTQEVEPDLINKGGIKPFWAHCKDQKHHNDYIVDVIKTQIETLSLQDIIVATRTNKEAEVIYNMIQKAGISCSFFRKHDTAFEENSVRVMTINNTKGLESQMVILANIIDGSIPRKTNDQNTISQELRLLYVGMTRASKMLYMVSYGQVSPFIQEMPKEVFEVVDFKDYRPFSPIKDELKEQLHSLVDKLMKEIEVFVKLKCSFHHNGCFQTCYKNLMYGVLRMEHIQEEAFTLKNSIDNNTTLKNLYDAFLKSCAHKLEEAHHELISFIACPYPIKQRREALSKRFIRFTEMSITAISTAEDILEGKQEDDYDYSPTLVSYSKALELELHHLFEYHRLFDDPFFEDKIQAGTQSYRLFDFLRFMQTQKGKLSDIKQLLDYINFRKNRNGATHTVCIDQLQASRIRDILMKENGVFDLINQTYESL